MKISHRYSLLHALSAFLPENIVGSMRRRLLRAFWLSEAPDNIILDEFMFSERAMLVEAIAEMYPFHSIAELGCGVGQNFVSLTRIFPSALFYGIDHDEQVIRAAQGLFVLDYPRKKVEFILNEALEFLENCQDNQFDLLVSSAFLLYLSPDTASKVVFQMFRVARKGVVFLEQVGKSERFQSEAGDYWLHDFQLFFKSLPASAVIEFRKVAHARWQIEHWQSDGHVITIRKPY